MTTQDTTTAAPGKSSFPGNPNLILPGEVLNIPGATPKPAPAPTPAPAPAPAPTPSATPTPAGGSGGSTGGTTSGGTGTTPADLYSGLTPSQVSENAANKAIADSYPTNAPDLEKERTDAMSQFQAQIDALNRVYAEQKALVSRGNDVRSGTERALLAKSGMIGQVSGAAETAGVDATNTQALGAVDTDYQTKSTNLLAQAQKLATDNYNAKLDAYRTGKTATVNYLKGQEATSGAAVDAIVKSAIVQGIDLSTADKVSGLLSKMTQGGLSVDSNQIINAYNTAKQTADAAKTTAAAATAKAAKDAQTVLSPGQQIADASGKIIATVPNKGNYIQGPSTTDAFGNQIPGEIYNKDTGLTLKQEQAAGNATGRTSTKVAGASATLPSGTTAGSKVLPAGVAGPLANGETRATTATKSGLSVDQYGLLANTDFNPGAAGQSGLVDSLAQKYLDQYLKNGVVPTASTLGRNMKPEAIAVVDKRARDLFFKATGQPLPTPQIIKNYQDLINNNNKLANNLQIQEQTVSSNVDLSIANMKKNDLNSSGFKPLNNLLNTIDDLFNDKNVGKLIAQNTTIQNELGSLLAVKNATGTTVYDKMTSAGIITSGDSEEQIKAKVGALLQEAGNFADSINNANAAAYKQTDPLLQDPNNPLRSLTVTDPNGDQHTFKTLSDALAFRKEAGL
jgi:hypothetical protein